MYELGYAAGKLTDEATVVLLNKDLGDKTLLPFDIAQNRVVDFSIKGDKKGVELEKTLEEILKEHLSDIKTKNELVEAESAKDKLTDAIENNKPARRLAETYFTHLYDEINKIYPGRYKYGGDANEYTASVIEAYEKALPLVQEFFDIVSMAAEYKNEDVLVSACKKLEDLSRYFEPLPEDVGGLSEISKEYHGLLVYELLSLMIGCVAKENWWTFLPKLTSIKFKRPNKQDKPIGLHRLYHFPQAVSNYIKANNNLRYLSAMIENRHSANDDTFQAYIDGSLLMWFLVDSPAWMLYLLADDDYSSHYQPNFIKQFKEKSYIEILTQASAFKTVEGFKDHLWGCINRSATGYQSDTLAPTFLSEGIKTEEDLGSQ